MAQLSEKKLTFVITSREQFKARDLLSKEVVLSSLSTDQAKKVLISRVSDKEIGENLSRTEEIVKLCGRVPLALCIVGSLLSDYTEERLVNDLEKEPMKLLDDGNESIERVIKTSFDLLSKDKQDALVLMSIFPGSFDSEATVAVISETCSKSGTLPVSVLRCLKNSSLVEQASSRRYQLHPLIRAFGQANDPRQVLVGAEKLACPHFISLLVHNARKFWSKDQCKAAIDLFSEDRHNFEYFLQVYAKAAETLECCKEFQHDFLQNCMYLEKCVSPSFYIDFLEGLVSFTKPKTQPVRRAELLCLRGHEKRKVGDRKKYIEDMEDAYKLYSGNSAKFNTNAVSAVYLLNSYADFVCKKGHSANNEKVDKINGNALELSESLERSHPERAEALLLAGRFAKRTGKRPEAEMRLQEALELFQEFLGTHLNTVYALKEMADFYFSGLTDANLEKALTHYKKALDMMQQLGMENNKANILIMKNYGICSWKRRNFDQGTKYLEQAFLVAERELLPDHWWKVLIKTSLALLHEKNKKIEDAKVLMQEGLEMCYRLEETINSLGKSHSKDVISFLNRHKQDFPKTKFPR